MTSEAKSVYYHGSTTGGIEILEARKRFTPGGSGIVRPKIYASSEAAYAAGHGFPWTSKEGFDIDMKEEETESGLKRAIAVLEVPKSLKARLNVELFVYRVDSTNFTPTPGNATGPTFDTEVPTPVLGVDSFPTVYDAVESYGGRVVYLDR